MITYENENDNNLTIEEYQKILNKPNIVKQRETYNKHWTWKKKIIYILKINNCALTTRRLTDSIVNHEPILKNIDRRNIIMIISGVLSQSVKENALKRRMNYNGKEYIYFLKG